MCKSFSKKGLSFALCFALVMSNLVYADTVVVGVAPGVGNKNVDLNASTTYLQNQNTGPGLMPSSATTNYSPIQGVSYDYSAGQSISNFDSNGAANAGPTSQSILSPAAHNAQLNTVTGNTSVISNGLQNSRVSDDNTSNTGPTVHEISAPVSQDVGLTSTNAGPGVRSTTTGNTANSSNTEATTNNGEITTVGAAVPQPTTNNTRETASVTTNSNGGVIAYTVNNNIQAVKPNIAAEGALVVNATTKQIYYSKGGFTAFHPAALTTLVTAHILLSNKSLDDVLVVTASAITGLESGAFTAGLKAGDTITVRDAIACMFVKSCCDVSNVVAENVAGSIQNFVGIMNTTVKSWGCIGTYFTNPTGLNSDKQVTNSYDAAIIMDKVTLNPTLKFLLHQQSYVLPATSLRAAKVLKTSNQLLIEGNKNYYPHLSASKMGYTSKAKYTMASELDYNGQRIIAVVLKANGSQFTDSIKLLNFAKVASLEAGMQGKVSDVTVTAADRSNVASQNDFSQTSTAGIMVAAPAKEVSEVMITGSNTDGVWKRDAKGWYFIKGNGQGASNEWIKYNDELYCVDSTGYLITGWRELSNGKVYYFDASSGALRRSTWINTSTGSYYLQSDGSLAKADSGTTKNIATSVGTYTIDDTGMALARVA